MNAWCGRHAARKSAGRFTAYLAPRPKDSKAGGTGAAARPEPQSEGRLLQAHVRPKRGAWRLARRWRRSEAAEISPRSCSWAEEPCRRPGIAIGHTMAMGWIVLPNAVPAVHARRGNVGIGRGRPELW